MRSAPSMPARVEVGRRSLRVWEHVRADVLALFVVAFVASFISTLKMQSALVSAVQDGTTHAGVEPLAIAKTLAETGRFADPFGTPTGPSAHMGPLFPAYLAAVLILVKGAAFRAILLRIGAALFHALELALLPLVSVAAFGETEPGFIAGLIAIVIPCFNVLPVWDSCLSGLATIAFCVAATRVHRSVLRMAALGCLGGGVLLLNPSLAIPAAVWAFFMARKQHWTSRGIGVAMLSCVVVCLPWTIRNYRVLGGLVPGRDNLGLELQVSNNDYATPGIFQNAASLARFHPSVNPEQVAEIRRRGELAYNRAKMAEAIAWIQNNPRRFALLTLRRVVAFWFPYGEEKKQYSTGIWIVTLLSIPGIILVAAQRIRGAYPLLWMLALAPLPFYVIQADSRYRTPLLWISVLLVGYAVHCLIHRRARPAS